MATLNTDYEPGEVSTITPGATTAGNPMLEAFIARRMQEYELARRQQIQQAARPAQQPVLGAMPVGIPHEYSGLKSPAEQREEAAAAADRADARREAAEERVYKARLRAIDLAPPMKYIESRPGVIGGYAPDVTMLPLSMRPGSSSFAASPDDELRYRTGAAKEQDFNTRLRTDRARGY